MKATLKKVKGNGHWASLVSASQHFRFNRQAGVSFLLIFAFCFLHFAEAKTMQNVENKSALAAAGFPKLVDEYIADLYARHPNIAAASGLHAWDGKLEDYSSSAIADEI